MLHLCSQIVRNTSEHTQPCSSASATNRWASWTSTPTCPSPSGSPSRRSTTSRCTTSWPRQTAPAPASGHLRQRHHLHQEPHPHQRLLEPRRLPGAPVRHPQPQLRQDQPQRALEPQPFHLHHQTRPVFGRQRRLLRQQLQLLRPGRLGALEEDAERGGKVEGVEQHQQLAAGAGEVHFGREGGPEGAR